MHGRGWWNPTRALLFSLVILQGIIAACGGTVVTIQPLSIHPGDSLTVHVQDLMNGTPFSLLIEGQVRVGDGKQFSFETANFVLPVSLQNGEIHITTEHTNWTGFMVKKGGTTISASQYSNGGLFQATETQNVTEGTYEFIRIYGEVLPGADTVTYRMQLAGEKEGPEDFRISFMINGVDNGQVTLIASSNGSIVLDQVITILPPFSGQESDGGLYPLAPLPLLPETLLPVETGSPHQGTVTSADGVVSITAPGKNISIIQHESLTAPGGWEPISAPYGIAPENTTFSSPVTLTFFISTMDVQNLTLFLAEWKGDEWRMLPSRIENGTINADIHRGGIYGLMTLDSDDGIAATSTPRSMTEGGSNVPPTQSLAPAVMIAGVALALIILFRQGRRS